MTVDVIPVIVKHCSKSAFDKSNDEEMSEMSGKSGKGGWKITATSDKK